MSYSTIYSVNGHIITDGVQSQAVCDETIITARACAARGKASVVVEDRGTRECYRVSPAGRRWRAPLGWVPVWDAEES